MIVIVVLVVVNAGNNGCTCSCGHGNDFGFNLGLGRNQISARICGPDRGFGSWGAYGCGHGRSCGGSRVRE